MIIIIAIVVCLSTKKKKKNLAHWRKRKPIRCLGFTRKCFNFPFIFGCRPETKKAFSSLSVCVRVFNSRSVHDLATKIWEGQLPLAWKASRTRTLFYSRPCGAHAQHTDNFEHTNKSRSIDMCVWKTYIYIQTLFKNGMIIIQQRYYDVICAILFIRGHGNILLSVMLRLLSSLSFYFLLCHFNRRRPTTKRTRTGCVALSQSQGFQRKRPWMFSFFRELRPRKENGYSHRGWLGGPSISSNDSISLRQHQPTCNREKWAYSTNQHMPLTYHRSPEWNLIRILSG